MTYNRSWKSGPSSSYTAKDQLIVPIGRQVFVNLPEAGSDQGDFKPFGRKPGALPGDDIRDGQQVEIIAWRPMAPEGLSYQIQRVSDRREWWTRATCLRISASAALRAQ